MRESRDKRGCEDLGGGGLVVGGVCEERGGWKCVGVWRNDGIQHPPSHTEVFEALGAT